MKYLSSFSSYLCFSFSFFLKTFTIVFLYSICWSLPLVKSNLLFFFCTSHFSTSSTLWIVLDPTPRTSTSTVSSVSSWCLRLTAASRSATTGCCLRAWTPAPLSPACSASRCCPAESSWSPHSCSSASCAGRTCSDWTVYNRRKHTAKSAGRDRWSICWSKIQRR